MLFGDFSISTFCSAASDILGVIGYILTLFKIAIPFIIIFYGMLDFGKAVTAEKPDEVKKSAKRLLWRAIAGILVFFVPTIVLWLFEATTTFKEDGGNSFGTCRTCLLHPAQCPKSSAKA